MRAANRLLSVLLALAIAAAGVLVIIEIIAAATDHDPVVVKWKGLTSDLATTQWKTAAPRVAAVILIIVGLLLLVFAFRRGKPATVALTTSAEDVEMTTTRRSLQRSLANSAAEVDGISHAHAKVKRRKVVIKARATSGLDKNEAKSRLESDISGRLDALSLAERKRLVVKVTPGPQQDVGEAPSGMAAADPTSLSSGPDRSASDGDDRSPVGSTSSTSGTSGSSSTGSTGGAA